jgi:hypothetical protein
MIKSIFCFLLFILVSNSIVWKVYDPAGDTVYRVLRVVKSPALGDPNDFEVFAAQAVAKPNQKGAIEDAVDFLFSVSGYPHFTIRHFQHSTDVVETRAARHGLRKIVEYTPSGTPGFSPDVDTIVSNYYLWNNTWTPLTLSTSVVNGANVYSLSTGTTDGVVKINVYLTDRASAVQTNVTGVHLNLDNNAIHHTLTIRNFPFKGVGTNLALKVGFESKTIIRDFSSGDPTENATNLIGTDGDTIQPIAAWANSVTVTGTNCASPAAVVKDIYRDVESVHDVDVSLPKLNVETSIALNAHITYFAFVTPNCQPQGIFWDPDLGIQDNSNVAVSSVPSFFLLLLLVFALSWKM